MGILDGIVEWIAEQIMYGLDLINTSVLGALGCDMSVFLRYFPAASTMYDIFVALAIGLILLLWVWNLFRNFGLGLGSEAEDPVKLSIRSILCLTALPLVLVALIGIAGSNLSAFILQFFRFLRNRRILTREPQKDNGEPKKTIFPNWLRKRRPGQENKEREPMPASRSSLRFDRKERKVTQHKTFLPTEETVRPLNPLCPIDLEQGFPLLRGWHPLPDPGGTV